MAVTQSSAAIWSSQTLTAGGGNTTSSAVAVGAYYFASLDFSLTNGGTGPTVAAQVQIQVSNDGTNFYNFGGAFVGSTAASAVVQWGGIQLPLGISHVRLVAGSNTGQNVTVNADIGYISAV
jgi:hypothetical protein